MLGTEKNSKPNPHKKPEHLRQTEKRPVAKKAGNKIHAIHPVVCLVAFVQLKQGCGFDPSDGRAHTGTRAP